MFLYIKLIIVAALMAGTAWVTHKVDIEASEREKLEITQQVLQKQTQVVNEQAELTKKAQNEKDSNQAHYELLLSQYRGIGLRQSGGSANQSPTLAIPSQGLRLLEPDVEILIGFAKQCSDTEIERNDVINKYNALIK